MSYVAIVSKIQVAPHPNADKIQIGFINGAKVIIGLDAKSDDLGVFFEDGGQLSTEFCKEHDLVSRKLDDGTKAGGFFSENRRVRVQGFRGVKSEGFWVPISHFKFTGYDLSKLKVGDTFCELNKVPICQKYYNKATAEKLAKSQNKRDKKVIHMPEHNDTTQFRFANLNKHDVVYISLKTHGTSWRYGKVKTTYTLPKWKKWLNTFLTKELFKRKENMQEQLGTRRVVLNKDQQGQWLGGYYGKGDPYSAADVTLKGKLKEHEIIYGEVLGYCENGAALFSATTKGNKDLTKLYGEKFDYSYGCPVGQNKLQVYRITQNGVELSWNQVIQRCVELNIPTVIEMERLIFDGDMDKLNALVESMLEGPDLMDSRHPREGVCIRVESALTGTKIYKQKSFSFRLIEGLVKDNEDNIDVEEVS